MKAVHPKNDQVTLPLVEWLRAAKILETDDIQHAVREYKRIALKFPVREQAYDRLMILFRKLKQPKDEMYWIEKAIDQFSKRFKKSDKRKNTKIASLSKSLAHAMGLTDKKGNAKYQPEPVARWQKRKELLQKKNK